MSVVAADVRVWPLNNIPESDLPDATITASISLAEDYVDGVKRSDATQSQIDNAVKAYGGYLAFMSHMNNQVADVAGSFTSGYFTPSEGTKGVPQVRTDNKTKLKALKDVSDQFLGMVSSVTDEVNQKPRLIPYSSVTHRQKDL